jgi:ribose-phosphate pyrophosphokinase
VLDTSRRRFPDGEQYVRVDGDVRGEDVAVFQSLGLNPDSYLVEYALLVDAIRGAGCRSVTADVPYLAYPGRQALQDGEPLSRSLPSSRAGRH